MEALSKRCEGNTVRVQEILEQEYGVCIPYSSLTRLVRANAVRRPSKKQSGIYTFQPGQEMQHDTSPYRILIGGKLQKVQCASLVLAYSRKLYMQFYPSFTRFEARVFLARAFTFMEGCCLRCIIDNTSVLIVVGTGPEAEPAPEIRQFEKVFGTRFEAHHVGHADRKARIERPFDYIRKNFLVGRTFNDWDDLNRQAREWCVNVSNKKVKRTIGMSPDAAFVTEKPHLVPLPPHIPPVYVTKPRRVDTQGYVHLDTNRYSVPYKLIGQNVEVHKHMESVRVYHRHELVAEHARAIHKRDARITEPGHRAPYLKRAKRGGVSKEEALLKEGGGLLAQYVAGLKKRSRGRGVVKMRGLLELKRTYPDRPFMAAVIKAERYGMYDLRRLEHMILAEVGEEFFAL